MSSHTSRYRPTRREIIAAWAHLSWTAGLVLGLPILLAVLFGWTLPTRVPDWGNVFSTPLHLVDPVVIRNVFVCAVWACWMVIVAYAVGDALDAARGIEINLGRRGPLAATAAKFVCSATVLLSLARPAVAVAAPMTTPVYEQVVTAHQPPDERPGSPVSSDEPTARIAHEATYVVERGDCLWSIAESRLGDGFRWSEIYDLNRDIISDPGLVRVGWTLTLPDPAPAAPPPAVTDQMLEPSATTPDFAGTGAPMTENAAPSSTAPTDAATKADGSSTEGHTPTPDDPNSEQMLPALVNPVAGITGAAVLATGLLLQLRRRRRRDPSSPPPLREPSGLERSLVAAADVPLVRWVGQELAVLAEQIAGRRPMPNPVAVEFSEATGIEILWDQPFPDAPAPWEAVPGDWAWSIRYHPEDEIPATQLAAPIAGLVTVGHCEGRQLLVNLEALGTLAVVGDAAAVEDFQRAVIVELGAGGETSDAYVVSAEGMVEPALVDSLPRLSIVTPEEACGQVLAVANSTARALTDSTVDSTFAYRTLEAPVLPFEATVMVAGLGDDGSIPTLGPRVRPHHGVAAVIAGDLPGAGARLTIDADGTATIEPLGLSFTAVGLPSEPQRAVSELIEPAMGDQNPSLVRANGEWPANGADRQCAPKSDSDADEEEERRSRRPSVPGHLADVAPPLTVQIDAAHHAGSIPEPRMLVKVLGTPRIVDGPALGRRELAVVIYVACASQPVRHEQIQDAIWRGNEVAAKSVYNLVSATRSALGQWNGNPILRMATRSDSTISLVDGVWTDVSLMRELAAAAERGPATDALPLLLRALALVEGPPFDAVGYDWAHTHQIVADAEGLIARVAAAACDVALEAYDLDQARWAVSQGLRGLPGHEGMYRRRMTIESAAGNPAAIRRAYAELLTFLDELETDPSPETTDLYNHLCANKTR